MCEENNETINDLLDECKVVDSIWEKRAVILRRNHRHRGRPNIIIVDWPMNSFKNKIVNCLWELLPGFTLWEIWKTQNRQTFENKSRKQREIWNSIEVHLKETISLQQWTWEEFSAEANE